MLNNFENQKYFESLVRKLVCINNLSLHYGRYLENIDPMKLTNYKLQQAKSKISMSNRKILQWRFNDIYKLVPYINTSWNGHQLIYTKKPKFNDIFDELVNHIVYPKTFFYKHQFSIIENNNALDMLNTIFRDVLNIHYWMLGNVLRELSHEIKNYDIVADFPFNEINANSKSYIDFILDLCFTDYNLYTLTSAYQMLQPYHIDRQKELDKFIDQLSSYRYRKLSISEYEY